MRPPGFEPGFPAISSRGWEAGVIDQAARQRSYTDLDASSGPRPLKHQVDEALVRLTYNMTI